MGKDCKEIEWKVPPENAGRIAETLLDKPYREDIRHLAMAEGILRMLKNIQVFLKDFRTDNNVGKSNYDIGVDERIFSYEVLINKIEQQIKMRGVDVVTMADAIENEIISHFGLDKENAEELE